MSAEKIGTFCLDIFQPLMKNILHIIGGTYMIKGDSLLVEEQLAHPGTSAGLPGYGFDFGGHFKSEIKSDSLILTRHDQNGLLYTYRLVK